MYILHVLKYWEGFEIPYCNVSWYETYENARNDLIKLVDEDLWIDTIMSLWDFDEMEWQFCIVETDINNKKFYSYRVEMVDWLEVNISS